ncbi:hypothetical protein [Ottowia sp. SB7-C50]|jgi:hypothetical protein|uniref:hypothetical protein n=1 Tax=Ottowia sp. SB7-C50 TaxID=3081231 RepID=UPI002955C980|nr:hypothetical protein [Ottowia sp. SB7-C50]WOP15646.1 hypothetical protein R0D99_00760 [Ottowia sp. SB7-C50]
MANYALRLPDSLLEHAREVAEQEKVSMNQLFATAIAEKLSAFKTEAFFRERANRMSEAEALAGFDAWLAASPDAPPMPGDELPDGVKS